MLDRNEAAFLRSIAEEGDAHAGRLVFADWLDDHDDSPRAEFIRVQCELASSRLSKKSRHGLRVRERELLDAHRHEWCQTFGLPVEDVTFDRGLIARMRLARWDGGKALDPACAPRFATLTELDLSGLQLGDDGLGAFAETAQFPALRKLILSDNGITDVGAASLASATGLPRLDTVYLFQNSITDGARAALERSSHFRLANLDLGEREEGYCMSHGEAEMARRQYVRTQLLPVVSHYFQTYERLRSAVLCVAQYWADEANDAVHGMLIVSELFEPTLEGVGGGDDETRLDPNVPNTHIPQKYAEGSSSEVSLWDTGARWDDNNGAIPLWSAFAPEEGSQEYGSYSEVYLPAVMFYRHGGYEILPMGRPHLDGVRPEWGWEE
jgi:uncharacterized protein (TIGR02996 family)